LLLADFRLRTNTPTEPYTDNAKMVVERLSPLSLGAKLVVVTMLVFWALSVLDPSPSALTLRPSTHTKAESSWEMPVDKALTIASNLLASSLTVMVILTSGTSATNGAPDGVRMDTFVSNTELTLVILTAALLKLTLTKREEY